MIITSSIDAFPIDYDVKRHLHRVTVDIRIRGMGTEDVVVLGVIVEIAFYHHILLLHFHVDCRVQKRKGPLDNFKHEDSQ